MFFLTSHVSEINLYLHAINSPLERRFEPVRQLFMYCCIHGDAGDRLVANDNAVQSCKPGKQNKNGESYPWGRMPYPQSKNKGEKNTLQKIPSSCEGGPPNAHCFKRSRIRAAPCPGPCTHLARAVCGFKPRLRLRLSYYWLIVIQYPRCPDPNLETSTSEV